MAYTTNQLSNYRFLNQGIAHILNVNVLVLLIELQFTFKNKSLNTSFPKENSLMCREIHKDLSVIEDVIYFCF